MEDLPDAVTFLQGFDAIVDLLGLSFDLPEFVFDAPKSVVDVIELSL
jgi:hypothetical protein